jgi:dTDP-4-dehydrorhamnose reductase
VTRILLLGAGGMLGRSLRASALPDATLIAVTHGELDVRDPVALGAALADSKPDWVVNASGYTDVDGAEDHQDEAFAINATAVGEMGRRCGERKCGIVHFSSDYVFDGAKGGFYVETDHTRPLNVYGASKLAGEELLRASGARHLIIRTQWVYGVGGKSFVGTLWERAQTRTTTGAVADQFGGSTNSSDLAAVVWAVLGRAEGTYHIANRGRVSRYMIAQRIFRAFGAEALLSSASSADFPARAHRPANSPLDVRKIEGVLGARMPEWTDAIDRYINARGRDPAPSVPPDPR